MSVVGKVYASRVRLDRGGYDSSGRYWGTGAPLYRVNFEDEENYFDEYTRAHSSKEAKDRVVSDLVSRGKLSLEKGVALPPGTRRG